MVDDGGPGNAVHLLADSTALGDRLRTATQVGPLRYMRGLPGYLRQSSGPGWALAGDAGYWKDPISTHGMTDAFRDAELLARAVLSAPDPGPAQRHTLSEYESVRDALALPLLEVTERLASYDWTVTTVRQLLKGLAAAMIDEVEVLASTAVLDVRRQTPRTECVAARGGRCPQRSVPLLAPSSGRNMTAGTWTPSMWRSLIADGPSPPAPARPAVRRWMRRVALSFRRCGGCRLQDA
ncbi:MAG TPA: hypothetical protein VHN80_01770 [Kineosporiaceae bacterium]|nr:hypothetical protein [Kineosporiaceae bacterium]